MQWRERVRERWNKREVGGEGGQRASIESPSRKMESPAMVFVSPFASESGGLLSSSCGARARWRRKAWPGRVGTLGEGQGVGSGTWGGGEGLGQRRGNGGGREGESGRAEEVAIVETKEQAGRGFEGVRLPRRKKRGGGEVYGERAGRCWHRTMGLRGFGRRLRMEEQGAWLQDVREWVKDGEESPECAGWRGRAMEEIAGDPVFRAAQSVVHDTRSAPSSKDMTRGKLRSHTPSHTDSRQACALFVPPHSSLPPSTSSLPPHDTSASSSTHPPATTE